MSKTQYLLDDLETVLDMLTRPWSEKISWATRELDCTEECNSRKITLTIGELRHYECSCPARIEYHSGRSEQLPILTQLLQLKWAVPVNGNSEGGNPNKSESQLPGNLVRPDELFGRIRINATQALTDAGFEPTAELDALRALVDPEQRADAAHLLAVPLYESLVELGYLARRVRLAEAACEVCGGELSVERDEPKLVRCEADGCGASWSPEDWLARHAAQEAARRAQGAETGTGERPAAAKTGKGARNAGKTRCPAGHEYKTHGRIGPDGKRRCRACDRARKAKGADA